MSTQHVVPQGPTICAETERPHASLIEAARPLPTSTLHEAAGRIGVMPSSIKPVNPAFKICGPALTVHSPSGDNLWLHRAIYLARPGDVLIVDVSGGYDFGYWGEIMSCAARHRSIAGLVINGCVRDGAVLAESDFPVFARGFCMRGTGKDYGARGWINFPTLFDDLVVNPGDLIVGDQDGVVAIPLQCAADVISHAQQREIKESAILDRIRGGERTLEVYNF